MKYSAILINTVRCEFIPKENKYSEVNKRELPFLRERGPEAPAPTQECACRLPIEYQFQDTFRIILVPGQVNKDHFSILQIGSKQ